MQMRAHQGVCSPAGRSNWGGVRAPAPHAAAAPPAPAPVCSCSHAAATEPAAGSRRGLLLGLGSLAASLALQQQRPAQAAAGASSASDAGNRALVDYMELEGKGKLKDKKALDDFRWAVTPWRSRPPAAARSSGGRQQRHQVRRSSQVQRAHCLRTHPQGPVRHPSQCGRSGGHTGRQWRLVQRATGHGGARWGGGGGGAGRQAGMQARARGTLMWGHVSVGGGGGGGGQLAGSHLVADGDLLAAAATLPARRADPARRVPAGAMLLRHEKSGKVFAIETEGLSQVGRAGSRQPPAAQGGGTCQAATG